MKNQTRDSKLHLQVDLFKDSKVNISYFYSFNKVYVKISFFICAIQCKSTEDDKLKICIKIVNFKVKQKIQIGFGQLH